MWGRLPRTWVVKLGDGRLDRGLQAVVTAATFETGRMIAMERGERMLIPCSGGGPCISRLVDYPPPLEIEERGGMYILVDDGPPEHWQYDSIPDRP